RIINAMRFPRIRGDRPIVFTMCAISSLFPPHTRGSTPNRILWGRGIPVSPAYAGIDRRRAGPIVADFGFPRIRGDRPRAPYRKSRLRKFPPHTRGSTVRTQRPKGENAVSPAYAGI